MADFAITDAVTGSTPSPIRGVAVRTRPKGAGFEIWFEYICFAAATTLLATLGGILVSLLVGGWPALSKFGFSFFVTSTWDPVAGVFGVAALMVDTVLVAALALLMAVPIAFGVAFFLVELCPTFLRRAIGTAVELLAGIPSIVFGMWGLFVFGPVFAQFVEHPLMDAAPPGSLWDHLTSGVPNGTGILAASIIVAMMVLPFIAATLRELLLTVPAQVRESAYGLGATTGEVVMKVTLPYVRRDHRFAHRQRVRRGDLAAAHRLAARVRLRALRHHLRRPGDGADDDRSAEGVNDGHLPRPRRRPPVPERLLRRFLLLRHSHRPGVPRRRALDPDPEGRGGAVAGHLHHGHAGGRIARRPAQRHRRLDHAVQRGDGDRALHRHSGRDLAGGIRPRQPLRQRGALPQRRAALGPVDPGRPVRLVPAGLPLLPPLQRLCGRRRPGDDRRAGDHTDHRGRAAAAAHRAPGSGGRAGHAVLDRDPDHPLARGDRRHPPRRPPGLLPHQRRDRAPAVHRPQQPVHGRDERAGGQP